MCKKFPQVLKGGNNSLLWEVSESNSHKEFVMLVTE